MVTLLQPSTVLIVWIATGAFFGLTASIYGAMIRAYRIGFFVHVLDGLWFAMAGAVTVLVLIATNWGVFRIWTLLALVVGYAVWSVLAGPLVHRFFYFLFITEARLFRIVRWAVSKSLRRAAQAVPGIANNVRSRIPERPRLPRIRWRRKPPRK